MADEGGGGEVVVKLSQEGGDDVVAKLKEIIAQIAEVGDQSKQSNAHTADLSEGVKGIGNAAAITAVSTAATAIMEYGEKALQAAEQVFGLIESLVEAREEFERQSIVLAQLNSATMGWSDAMDSARENLEAIRGMTTGSSVDTLVTTFQRLQLMFGGTDKELRGLTQQMTLFSQATGASEQILLRVLQMAEQQGKFPSGGRGQMGLVVGALQNAGITAEDLQTAKEMNESLGYLTDHLKLSKEAVAALSNSWKDLKTDFDHASGGITESLGSVFDPLKKVLGEINELLKSTAVKTFVADLANVFQQLLGAYIKLESSNPALLVGMQSLTTALSAMLIPLKVVATEWLALIGLFQQGVDVINGIAKLDFSHGISGFMSSVGSAASQSFGDAKASAGQIASLWSKGEKPVAMESSHGSGADDDRLTTRLKSAQDAYDKLMKSADEEHTLAGLVGLEKQLAEVAKQTQAAKDSAQAAWDKLSVPQQNAAEAAGRGLGQLNTVLDEAASEKRTALIDKATGALQKLFDEADRKEEAEGLTGLDKQINTIDASADKMIEKIRAAYNALTPALREQMLPATFAAIDTVNAGADEQADAAVTASLKKELDKRVAAEKDYVNTVDALQQGSTNDQIRLNDFAAQKAIDSMTERVDKDKKLLLEEEVAQSNALTDEGDFEGARAAYDAYVAKVKVLDDDLAAYREKQLHDAEVKNKLIADEQLGNWSDYYSTLIQKAHDAGDYTFATLQATGKKVADAMAANAETAAQGFAAGEAKIVAGMTSMGQDVSTLMTAVWGNLTTAFETGFYDILSGKFSSLKDVLASLWDSILKDFSKLLAQMLERWILTGDAMGNGQSKGGVGSILSLLTGSSGDNSVQTPLPMSTSYNQDGSVSGGSYGPQPQGGGNSGLSTLGTVGAYGAYAYGAYKGISSIFTPHTTSTPTYNGQSLGQTADFGGAGGGAALAAAGSVAAVAAAATVAAAAAEGAVTAATLAAAATSAVVPIVGWIVAAVLLIVAAAMAIFSGPQEGHIYVAIQDAFDKSGATSAVGNFIGQIVDSTANFVGSLALKAVGPDGVGKYVAAYQNAFKDMYGNARFDIAAGSPDDLQKDVQNFFKQVLPAMAMRAAFGQIGYDPSGNRDSTGGVGGLDWNLNNSQYMDSSGNWIKKQLYDPNAPIPMMLTGLGFSADKINEIATKLASGTDIEAFKTYLEGLVGVVVDLGTLAKEFGRTTQQWFDFIHTTNAQKGTSAEFTTDLANLKAQGSMLDTIFGDDRVTAAKQLVTDSGTLLNNMASALGQILAFIDQIKDTTASTIKSYQNKLLTPAELEAQARGNYATDIAGISGAKNPADVMTAFKNAMADLGTVLDAIVARIQSIKSLQQSYADFRTQMATDAGPQFGTDPAGWLAKNATDIAAIEAKLPGLVGDDAVKGAQTLLDLTTQRYNNEVAQLAKINGLIQSITEQGQTTSDNLKMQGMGSVVNGQWVPDVHAQGDFLKGQYDDLMKQLGAATTPEDVQKIYGKLENVISQLAAQPQDPAHYAESRTILSGMNDAATKAATDLLKKWGKDLDTDLSGTGDKLKAGEDALAKALAAAQTDFTTELALMSAASDVATASLTKFADGLTTAMNALVVALNHWIWVMTHPDGTPDPNGPQTAPGQGPGTTIPKPSDEGWTDDPDRPGWQIKTGPTGRILHRQKPAPGPITGDTNGPVSATAGTNPAVNVTVTVNSGTPEDIAAAAASAVYGQTLDIVQKSQVALVKAIRTNPTLTTPAWSSR